MERTLRLPVFLVDATVDFESELDIKFSHLITIPDPQMEPNPRLAIWLVNTVVESVRC